MVLLSILRKLKQKEHELRVLVLGLDNSGKTTMVKKISGENIDQVSPTLGFHICALQHRDYTLNIWDVGGQASIRSYWRNYFEQTDALVWLIDSCDRIRFEDCKRELHSLLTEERLAGASLLVLANKQDLAGAATCEELVDMLELKNVSGSHHWHILPTSALTGLNLAKGFDWLVEDVASRIFSF